MVKDSKQLFPLINQNGNWRKNGNNANPRT